MKTLEAMQKQQEVFKDFIKERKQSGPSSDSSGDEENHRNNNHDDGGHASRSSFGGYASDNDGNVGDNENSKSNPLSTNSVLLKLSEAIESMSSVDFRRFNGNSSQDVDSWISHCIDVADIHHMSKKMMFKKAKLSLDGRARTAWDAITGTIPDTFDKICKFLRKSFGFRNPRRHWMKVIRNTRKQSNEDITDFNRSFQVKVNKLKAADPALFSEDDCIVFYKNALPSSYKAEMEMFDYKSLERAYIMSVRVSNKIRVIESSSRSSSKPSRSESSDSNNRNYQYQRNTNQRRRVPYCKYCVVDGHHTNDCVYNDRNHNSYQNESQLSDRGNSNLKNSEPNRWNRFKNFVNRYHGGRNNNDRGYQNS